MEEVRVGGARVICGRTACPSFSPSIKPVSRTIHQRGYAADNVVRVGEISPDDFRVAVERIFECIPLKAHIKNFSGTSYVTSVFRRRYGLSWGLSHLEYLR